MTSFVLSFPCGLAGKQSACNVGDLGSIPGLGRSPGEGKDYPFQRSGPEDLGAIPGLGRSPGEGSVFWPGEFHGLYSRKESDTTEPLSLSFVLHTSNC